MKVMRKIATVKLKGGTVSKRDITRAVKEVKALREAGKLKHNPRAVIRISCK